MSIFELALVAALSNPAFAQDAQTTAMTSQQVATLLLQRQEKADAAEAAYKKAKREADAAKKAYEDAKVALPTNNTVETRTETRVEVPSADVAAAKTAYEQAMREAEEAKRQYEAAKAALPTTNETHTVETRVEVRTSGFHPIVYLGGALVLGMPIPDVSQGVSGRLTLGVRPTWEASEHGAFGLSVEGDHAVGGWGVRAVPQYLIVGSSGEWGFGGGAGYNCDALTGAGCMAEHTGGLARVSWDKGSHAVGVLVTTDLEVNYVTIPGGSGVETRLVLGLHGYLGNARPQVVTVE